MMRLFLKFLQEKTDEGETTLTTAKRELEEETGYRPNKVEFLGTYYPSPALY